MKTYEEMIQQRISLWEKNFMKSPGLLEKTSKKFSHRINTILPAKVQSTITSAVKMIVRTTLFGVEYVPKRKVQAGLPLDETDQLAQETLSLYQKIATAEGAGTGAGGIFLAAVDFPALIAIKMKFLFELAHIYGYNTNEFSERIFILSLFQLTYADHTKRQDILNDIKHWHTIKTQWSSDSEYYQQMDWDAFQQEYRDAIDFKKMLQLLPGIGAVAGAWANYTILDELGEVAMNGYRLRRLELL